MKVINTIILSFFLSACGGGGNPNIPDERSESTSDDEGQNTAEENILVYINTGKTQCFDDGLRHEESTENLVANGLDVISTQCGYVTGIFYASVCGGATGEIISHEIRRESLEDASLLGYSAITELVDEAAGLGYQLDECESN